MASILVKSFEPTRLTACGDRLLTSTATAELINLEILESRHQLLKDFLASVLSKRQSYCTFSIRKETFKLKKVAIFKVHLASL
jgi:hypothetical protein